MRVVVQVPDVTCRYVNAGDAAKIAIDAQPGVIIYGSGVPRRRGGKPGDQHDARRGGSEERQAFVAAGHVRARHDHAGRERQGRRHRAVVGAGGRRGQRRRGGLRGAQRSRQAGQRCAWARTTESARRSSMA